MPGVFTGGVASPVASAAVHRGVHGIRVAEPAEQEGLLQTFREATTDFLAAHQHAWRSQKHLQSWRHTVEGYAFPVMGDKAVDAIQTVDILACLHPLLTSHPMTAHHLRGRIAMVLAMAFIKENIERANPARWADHLSAILPPRPAGVHMPSASLRRIPHIMMALQARRSPVDRALMWTVLTACRRGETLSLTFQQVDVDARIWIIPAEVTKVGREHRIPLSTHAIALLPGLRTAGLVFPISRGAMLRRLKNIDVNATVHGMRASFVEFAVEMQGADRELVEHALGHVQQRTWSAYHRSDMCERRRSLMEGWGNFCLGQETSK